jgi:elongation factor P
MALIGANELKRKMFILVEEQPFAIAEVTFASPSARGASTMVRTKLRNLLTNAVLEKSFKTSEKFEEADVELKPASFLYADGDGYHFMDEESYEQFALSADGLGDDRLYLKDGLQLQIRTFNGAPIAIQLPTMVELAVKETEPAVKGDSASGGTTKAATLETGLIVRVPLFIKEGEVVRINTELNEFVSRA